jgi:hypothetical protein
MVVVLRVILLIYTGFAAGGVSLGLVSDRRHVIGRALQLAIIGGAAFAAFTTLFRFVDSNVLLLGALMIPVSFPLAFLRRRSP